jgi:hypothetical protein
MRARSDGGTTGTGRLNVSPVEPATNRYQPLQFPLRTGWVGDPVRPLSPGRGFC